MFGIIFKNGTGGRGFEAMIWSRVGEELDEFKFKNCLSSSKVNENVNLNADSSQEELVQVDNTQEIPWIQQKSQEVFIKHGRGSK